MHIKNTVQTDAQTKLSLTGFADSLTQQLVRRYPPALDSQPDKRPSVNRLTRILEEACAKAQDYKDSQKLGWFGKAKLSNRFKWNLQEAGYTKEFIDFATEAMVVHLSRKKQ